MKWNNREVFSYHQAVQPWQSPFCTSPPASPSHPPWEDGSLFSYQVFIHSKYVDAWPTAQVSKCAFKLLKALTESQKTGPRLVWLPIELWGSMAAVRENGHSELGWHSGTWCRKAFIAFRYLFCWAVTGASSDMMTRLLQPVCNTQKRI